MRHEAETKSNAYWLGLLAHLQASSVPRKVGWNLINPATFSGSHINIKKVASQANVYSWVPSIFFLF